MQNKITFFFSKDFRKINHTKDEMMKQLITKSAFGCMLLSLVGCASYQDNFDCKVGQGFPCHSLSAVKKKMSNNEIDLEGTPAAGSMKQTEVSVINSPDLFFHDSSTHQSVESNEMIIHRVAEKPIRVWFAPFQDEEGNLHESAVVHTVLSSGSWKIQD